MGLGFDVLWSLPPSLPPSISLSPSLSLSLSLSPSPSLSLSLSLSPSLSCTGKTDIRHDSKLGKYPFPRCWNIVPFDLGLQLHKEPIDLVNVLCVAYFLSMYHWHLFTVFRFKFFLVKSLSFVVYVVSVECHCTNASACPVYYCHLVSDSFVQRFLCTQLKGFQVFIVASCCVSKYRLFSQRARDDCIYHKLRNSPRDAHARINYIRISPRDGSNLRKLRDYWRLLMEFGVRANGKHLRKSHELQFGLKWLPRRVFSRRRQPWVSRGHGSYNWVIPTRQRRERGRVTRGSSPKAVVQSSFVCRRRREIVPCSCGKQQSSALSASANVSWFLWWCFLQCIYYSIRTLYSS